MLSSKLVVPTYDSGSTLVCVLPLREKRTPCISIPYILSNVHDRTRATDSPNISSGFLSILTTPWLLVCLTLQGLTPRKFYVRSVAPGACNIGNKTSVCPLGCCEHLHTSEYCMHNLEAKTALFFYFLTVQIFIVIVIFVE